MIILLKNVNLDCFVHVCKALPAQYATHSFVYVICHLGEMWAGIHCCKFAQKQQTENV